MEKLYIQLLYFLKNPNIFVGKKKNLLISLYPKFSSVKQNQSPLPVQSSGKKNCRVWCLICMSLGTKKKKKSEKKIRAEFCGLQRFFTVEKVLWDPWASSALEISDTVAMQCNPYCSNAIYTISVTIYSSLIRILLVNACCWKMYYGKSYQRARKRESLLLWHKLSLTKANIALFLSESEFGVLPFERFLIVVEKSSLYLSKPTKSHQGRTKKKNN